MDSITGLPVSTGWKSNSYDLILIIVDQLIKTVYYKSTKVTIDAFGRVEVIMYY